MHRDRHAVLFFLATTALLCVGTIGCVSTEAYELAKKDADNARLLYQNEQRRGQELALSNKKMKQHLEELDATLKDMREKVSRTEREWRETRDELLRIKIEQEQRRGALRHSPSQLGLEDARPAPVGPEGPPRKVPPGSDETKRRLRDLLEQLQDVLQQF
jgi:hypothetical protein